MEENKVNPNEEFEKRQIEYNKALAELAELKNVDAFVVLARSKDVDENGNQKGVLACSGNRLDVISLLFNIDRQIIDLEAVVSFKKLIENK